MIRRGKILFQPVDFLTAKVGAEKTAADHVKVAGANVEHGLLTIDLVREVPEELKPRRIEFARA